MSYQTTHPSVTERPIGHVIAWTLGPIGILAAAIGVWLAAVPEGGTLTFINQTWAREEIPDYWAPTLLMAGGGLATLAMAFSAAREWFGGHGWGVGLLEALGALVGAFAFGLGVAILL